MPVTEEPLGKQTMADRMAALESRQNEHEAVCAERYFNIRSTTRIILVCIGLIMGLNVVVVALLGADIAVNRRTANAAALIGRR